MYEVLDKGTMKFEILPHLLVEKRGYRPKSGRKKRSRRLRVLFLTIQ